MLGIYIHIPFCKKACHYCDFHFSTSLKTYPNVVEAIILEIKQRANYLPSKNIQSIYFGGGTPSLLQQNDLQRILATIHSIFRVDPKAEITLEANPDDLSPEKCFELAACGINRLSVGIQSFFNEHLTLMNRAHNSEQAKQAIHNAKAAGITNITADLIYALPNLTNEQWIENIQTMINLNIPHISAYSLTVEPKTALAHKVKTGEITETPDELAEEQFTILRTQLKAAGYDHYEISNFALPHAKAVHNSSYWAFKPYLGIGPSAHSFNGESRQWNFANNSKYANGVLNETTYFEIENLTELNRLNEQIMVGLRTTKGCSIAGINEWVHPKIYTNFLNDVNRLVTQNLLLKNNNVISIPEELLFKADGIIAELFQVD